jgi:hypothetical protein
MHRRSHPASHLQEEPTWQGKQMYKGRKHAESGLGPHLLVHQMKTVARGPTKGSSEPGQAPSPVHFGGKILLILLALVINVSRQRGSQEPTSQAIKGEGEDPHSTHHQDHQQLLLKM